VFDRRLADRLKVKLFIDNGGWSMDPYVEMVQVLFHYANFQFKKGNYKEYIYYYSLAIYNSLADYAINEQKECIKVQLDSLKNNEEFTDRKTNKAFQEIGASSNQDLFVKTLFEILKSFKFEELYKLIFFLNNKQKDLEEIQIEGIKNNKIDWPLWSSKEFCNMILKYDEELFIEYYNTKLKNLLIKSL
ncbi:MAG: hypothetical protein WCJ61_05080, partial [Paludibacter sp.]